MLANIYKLKRSENINTQWTSLKAFVICYWHYKKDTSLQMWYYILYSSEFNNPILSVNSFLQIRRTVKKSQSSVSVNSTTKVDVSSSPGGDDAAAQEVASDNHFANKENVQKTGNQLVANVDVASALFDLLDAPMSANVDGEDTQTKKTSDKTDPKTRHKKAFVYQREDERFDQDAYRLILRRSIQEDFRVFLVNIWEVCVELESKDPRLVKCEGDTDKEQWQQNYHQMMKVVLKAIVKFVFCGELAVSDLCTKEKRKIMLPNVNGYLLLILSYVVLNCVSLFYFVRNEPPFIKDIQRSHPHSKIPSSGKKKTSK